MVLLGGCDETALPTGPPSGTRDDPTKPSFGRQKVQDQRYVAGIAIPHLILPRATGGDGTLTYRLTPVPPGLSFNASARTLSGVPANTGSHPLKYRVEDADGDTAELSFRIDADPLTTIYWASGAAVRRSDMNSIEVESVVTNDPFIVYLAVDHDSAEPALYYVDFTPDFSPVGIGGNRIRRAAISGKNVRDVVTAVSGWEITAVVVDPDNGKLYWSEAHGADLSKSRIRRANVDGSAPEEIITTNSGFILRLALDADLRKLCWNELALTFSDVRLRCANIDGSARENVATGAVGTVALADGKVYWSESVDLGTSSEIRIWRALLDGSEADMIVTTSKTVYTIAVDSDTDKLYWGEADFSANVGRIRRANLDGTAAEDVMATSALSLDVAGGRLYWTDLSYTGTGIRSANLDGTDPHDIVSNRSRQFLDGIALDVIEKKMYWTEETEDRGPIVILRADLDGSTEEVVGRVERSAEFLAEHLEFDVVDRKLYWIEQSCPLAEETGGGVSFCTLGDAVIRRANLSGIKASPWRPPQRQPTPYDGAIRSSRLHPGVYLAIYLSIIIYTNSIGPIDRCVRAVRSWPRIRIIG